MSINQKCPWCGITETAFKELDAALNVTLDKSGTVAVDREYFWQPITTCPRGAKVQLLGRGGVAMYGAYHGKEDFYTHWAPLPKLKRIES